MRDTWHVATKKEINGKNRLNFNHWIFASPCVWAQILTYGELQFIDQKSMMVPEFLLAFCSLEILHNES